MLNIVISNKLFFVCYVLVMFSMLGTAILVQTRLCYVGSVGLTLCGINNDSAW